MMTPAEALDIVEQARKKLKTTGEEHDLISQAMNVLRVLAVKEEMSDTKK